MKKLSFFAKNVSEPSNPPDELAQNVSKIIPVGRIIPPFFFESSESDRVVNYIHDSNSIFRAGRIKSVSFFGRTVTNVGGECQDHRNRAQCIIADVLQVQGSVQVVGTSSSVRAERTTDVAQVVRSWSWYAGSTVGTTKIDLTRSTNLPKIVPFLRYQISRFLRVDCQPIRVHRRVRPGRHLHDPAMRQPRTISHPCRRGPVLPSARPCTRRCTLNLTSLLHADLLHHLQPCVRPSRQALPPALPPALHCGRVVRKMPTQAADYTTYVADDCATPGRGCPRTLRRAPMRCRRRFHSAASPPAAGPGPRLTRSCC